MKIQNASRWHEHAKNLVDAGCAHARVRPHQRKTSHTDNVIILAADHRDNIRVLTTTRIVEISPLRLLHQVGTVRVVRVADRNGWVIVDFDSVECLMPAAQLQAGPLAST